MGGSTLDNAVTHQLMTDGPPVDLRSNAPNASGVSGQSGPAGAPGAGCHHNGSGPCLRGTMES